MIEATAVQPTGRITPQDSGIWLDAHVETLKRHVEFAHSQKRLIGIQLAHAGRKASTVAPWVSSEDGVLAIEQVGGWLDDVIGPNSESYRDGYPTPRTMTLAEIDRVKRDFVKGAQRAIQAGFDVIELHFAHGYLISSFLTPAVNQRTDRYGGNFENRTRFALEIVAAVREVMPQTMPLFARISSTDWLDNSPEWTGESWTVDGSIRFASLLADHGVDVLDVSSGGNHKQQNIIGGPGYQAPFAKKIKKAVGERILVSSVGSIQTGVLAEELIRGGRDGSDTPLDLIAAGRSFQKNPGLVWAWADELDVSVNLAKQIGWGFGGRVSEKSTSMSIP